MKISDSYSKLPCYDCILSKYETQLNQIPFWTYSFGLTFYILSSFLCANNLVLVVGDYCDTMRDSVKIEEAAGSRWHPYTCLGEDILNHTILTIHWFNLWMLSHFMTFLHKWKDETITHTIICTFNWSFSKSINCLFWHILDMPLWRCRSLWPYVAQYRCTHWVACSILFNSISISVSG